MSSSSSSSSSFSSSSCSSFGRIFIYSRDSDLSDIPASVRRINTTSRSADEKTRRLSPFFLGPVEMTPFADGQVYMCHNVENAWQYSKCYSEHEKNSGAFKKWMQEGFARKTAQRFPMGRGAKPAFSYHNGKQLGYIEARLKIYAPTYAKAVEKYAADVLAWMKSLVASGQDIALFDFDGYRHDLLGMSLHDVLFNPKAPMGHAFVIKMILLGQRLWETEKFDLNQVKEWTIHTPRKPSRKLTDKQTEQATEDSEEAKNKDEEEHNTGTVTNGNGNTNYNTNENRVKRIRSSTKK